MWKFHASLCGENLSESYRNFLNKVLFNQFSVSWDREREM